MASRKSTQLENSIGNGTTDEPQIIAVPNSQNGPREGPTVSSPTTEGSILRAPEPVEKPRKCNSGDIFTFWITLFLTVAMGVGLSYRTLAPSYLAVPFEKDLPAGYGSGIYLLGVVESLDISSRLLQIQWIVHSCEESGPYKGCNPLRDPTNVYMNENATISSTFDDNSAVVQYRANLTSYIIDELCPDPAQCWQEQLLKGVPYEQTMKTSHIFSVRPAARGWKSSAQAYPFDNYEIYATLLALDPIGLAANPPVFNSRRMIGASMTGTVPNFSIKVNTRDVQIPSNSKFQWLMVTISIQRADIVIGYALLIWLINCMSKPIISAYSS
ncbi:hypothetical protein FRC03_001922 [Tulasnella sp. 419]|nr:hypothetical protein FRC03_001922 [Tulasnella sp. 419]